MIIGNNNQNLNYVCYEPVATSFYIFDFAAGFYVNLIQGIWQ